MIFINIKLFSISVMLNFLCKTCSRRELIKLGLGLWAAIISISCAWASFDFPESNDNQKASCVLGNEELVLCAIPDELLSQLASYASPDVLKNLARTSTFLHREVFRLLQNRTVTFIDFHTSTGSALDSFYLYSQCSKRYGFKSAIMLPEMDLVSEQKVEKFISSLQTLRLLHLRSLKMDFQEKCFSSLAHHAQSLEVLNIQWPDALSFNDINALAVCKKLTKLGISLDLICGRSDFVGSHLIELYKGGSQLRSLSLGSCVRLKSEDFAVLGRFTLLQDLTLERAAIDGARLAFVLGKLSHLQSLSLAYCNHLEVSRDVFAYHKPNQQLKSLYVNNSPLNDLFIRGLMRTLAQLTSLCIGGGKTGDLSPITLLTTLQTLSLVGTGVAGSQIGHFMALLTQLRTLDISENDLFLEDEKRLIAMGPLLTSLTGLTLDASILRGKFLSHMVEVLPNLHHLDMARVTVSHPSEFTQLTKLGSLYTLNLSHTRVDPAILRVILQNNMRIHEVNIFNSSLITEDDSLDLIKEFDCVDLKF